MLEALFWSVMMLFNIEQKSVSGDYMIFATVGEHSIVFEKMIENQDIDHIYFEHDEVHYYGLGQRDIGSHTNTSTVVSSVMAFLINPFVNRSYEIWLHGYIRKEGELVGFWSGFKEETLCRMNPSQKE